MSDNLLVNRRDTNFFLNAIKTIWVDMFERNAMIFTQNRAKLLKTLSPCYKLAVLPHNSGTYKEKLLKMKEISDPFELVPANYCELYLQFITIPSFSFKIISLCRERERERGLSS